jgi:uncharacterized protein (DUF1684 family)
MRLKLIPVALLFSMISAAFGQEIQRFEANTSDYNSMIEKYRTGRNIKMLYTEGTPLTPEQQASFKGLKYFEPDVKYRVGGILKKARKLEVILMKTSTDRVPAYERYGEVTFELDGKELKLAVYRNKKMLDLSQDTNMLFIPFRDMTSGSETYGGGRYIDCEIPVAGDIIDLDFNKAYNPYCAYNHKYSCVIPPEENRLPVKIKAGEKVYEEEIVSH